MKLAYETYLLFKEKMPKIVIKLACQLLS